MEVVNEGSVAFLTCSFADEDGEAVIPTAASYRIDDISGRNAVEIKGATDIAPTASSHDIEITGAQNAILDSKRVSETRRLTLTFTYGVSSKPGTAEYLYIVKNLGGVS